MTGLVHKCNAACGFNVRRQPLRALDVEHDGAARHPRQHIAGEQHHLPVRVNVLAIFGDDAEAVAITVKRQADFGIGGFQGVDQVAQVFRLARVGMVVGEAAIDLAEKLDHLTTKRAENRWSRSAGDAVAGIDHDLHGP